jgi:TonB family protein
MMITIAKLIAGGASFLALACGAGASPRAIPAPTPRRQKPPASIKGRLPPYVIQRTVRSAFVELRKCYQAGLGRNARLEGQVTVRFVINRAGQVQDARSVTVPDRDTILDQTAVRKPTASTPATTLNDPEAVACIVDRFRALRFPARDSTIRVVYPIRFSPDDPAE